MKHIQFIILLLITTVSFSQEIPQALNLQEAIDYALQNNRVAKNAQPAVTKLRLVNPTMIILQP